MRVLTEFSVYARHARTEVERVLVEQGPAWP
ncbi:hypothetical protein C8E86_7010 [Catellatospora citrea]|nr:hypothetical protein C8E86_7010 [Catellatospora citrea]